MSKPRLPKSTIECPDCTKASGFPLGDAKGFSRRLVVDRMIAATALANDLSLATLNPRDFRDIPGLKIEDWSS